MSAAENICPCPYCGAKAVVTSERHYVVVSCTNSRCRAHGPRKLVHDLPAEEAPEPVYDANGDYDGNATSYATQDVLREKAIDAWNSIRGMEVPQS